MKEIIIEVIKPVFEKTIGKIFSKERARYNYRKKLKDIVEGFSDCLGNRTTLCSLSHLIDETKGKVSGNEEIILRQLSKRVELLKEWFQNFRHNLDITYLRNLEELFENFRRILSNCHNIFEDFRSVLSVLNNREEIVKGLKEDSYGYPLFKRLYDSTLTKFEDLTREASKELKIKPARLPELPEL